MVAEMDELVEEFRERFESMRREGGPNDNWPPMVTFYRDDREIALLIVEMDDTRQKFATNVMRAAYGLTPDVIVLAVDTLTRAAQKDTAEAAKMKDHKRGDFARDRADGDVSVQDAFAIHRIDSEKAAVTVTPYTSFPHTIVWDDEHTLRMVDGEGAAHIEGLIFDILRDAMKATRPDGMTIVEKATEAWKATGTPFPGESAGASAEDIAELTRLHADLAAVKLIAEDGVVVRYACEPKHLDLVEESMQREQNMSFKVIHPEDMPAVTDTTLHRMMDREGEKDA